MNVFWKQAVRRPVFTMLLTLLLSLSIALSCIGCAAWVSAKKHRDSISAAYTTIAIPVEPELSGRMAEEITSALQARVFADQAAQEAPMLSAIDRRCLLSAHIAGSKSLSSSRMDPSEYNTAFDGECYSLAVFALRCDTVTEKAAEGTLLYDAAFQVEEILALSDAYDCFPAPDTIHIYSDIRTQDGSVPFEEGKNYLVFGQYQDRRVIQTQDGYHQSTGENRYLIPFPELFSNLYGEPSSLRLCEQNGQSYHCTVEGQLPWVCAYSGTVRDLLSGAEHRVWSETILPLCRLNYESAAVLLTDQIQSLYSFNTDGATLLSGRFFTQEEYQSGAAVCIVSAAYAEVNGLALGDTLTLEYYDSGFGEYNNGATANSLLAGEDPGPYRQRYYMSPDAATGVCEAYTIVGIYTGPRFAFGVYQCNADTIFVPKASVPGAQEYEMPANALLNTFILHNSSAEEFEAYLQQRGLGGQFLYFDQGFSAMQTSLNALEANAARFMLIGIGTFLLAAALFVFLQLRRMKPSIRVARLLGIAPRSVFADMLTVLVFSALAAALIGALAAAALFRTVTAKALASPLPLLPIDLLLPSAAAFVLLSLASLVGTAAAANRRLMN